MNNILVINGPNLNLLGKREPEIYGNDTLEKINDDLRLIANKNNYQIDFFQTNSESKIIDRLQDAYLSKKYCALIINAASYTHSSIAIYDVLKLFHIPIMEVHLSDPEKREKFRHFSYISLVATEIYKGMGNQGYFLALEKILTLKQNG